jgi:RNA polymerase sigma factor (sigma-70 family)
VHDQTEATWIGQAKAGDRHAFAELVRHYWGRIFRWLCGMEGCAHRAEDLTQEVFVKAWQALPGYRDVNFRAWLFRIARNCLIDEKRGRHCSRTEALPADLSGNEPEPVERALANEFQAEIEEACRKLPGPIRSAFLLAVEEKMTYAEIAEALEIKEATARWRVYKARRLLMRTLGSTKDSKNP